MSTSPKAMDEERAIDTKDNGLYETEHVERTNADLEKHNGEVLLFVADGIASGLKVASDGHTVLVPQPSESPDDPMNWSSFKKHQILFLLAFAAWGGDFQSGAGIPLLASQSDEWGLSLQKVNEAGNLNVLLLGLGGLVWVPGCYCLGRLPILFWTQLLGTGMALGAVLAPDFATYYAFRPLTSLFLTAGQVIGLLFIKDMFSLHLHAQKIGYWVLVFFISPYAAPLVCGFMTDQLGDWRPSMWLVFAYSLFILLMVILIGDETWYDRSIPSGMPPREVGIQGRFKDLVGITGWKLRAYKPSVTHSVLRLLEVFTKPVILIVIVIYGLTFMWAVGINITSSIVFATPASAGGYGYSLRAISFVYFTPVVAVCIGELVGHFANDGVARRFVKRNSGIFRPECRLQTYFLAAPLMIIGLVLTGWSIQRKLNVGLVVVGWGTYIVGVMLASVSITAYLLDSFPTAAAEVAAVVNLAGKGCGFSVGYFQVQWAERVGGFGVSLSIQAATLVFAVALVAGLSIFGAKIRKAGGALHFSPR